MTITVSRQIDGGPVVQMSRRVGNVPIMVRSARCHLQNLSRAELVKHREEAGEWGGYFILNGNERLVRLLAANRRNHIFAIVRSSFENRGKNYTKYATSMRCVRTDQTSKKIECHYLDTGSLLL